MKTSSLNPLLDIVVLVHDRADWADLCVRAVENQTKNPYRLIIVDMASREEATFKMLEDAERRGHTVVRLAENKSFSHGCNAGVMAGDAKFICLLNDDALVTEGWDTAMLHDAINNGLVGARSNYVSGFQGDPSKVGEPPYLIFVCVMLRRQVWNAIGPMDGETFDGFSCEDLDYSWRVKKGGLKLKVSDAYVLHAGSRTLQSTAGDAEAQKRNNAKYTLRLQEKWGKEFVSANTKLDQKVLVVTYHAEEWTRIKFMASMLNMRHFGGHPFTFFNSTRAPIHFARQTAADYALDKGFDVLVQFDDDATFPHDVLGRLLRHGKEVVTAIAYQRKPPHLPCIYSSGDDGLSGVPLLDYEHTGLRTVDLSGFHCSAIRTSVFKKMRDAGIKQFYGGFENKVGEDFAMSHNLKKIGVPLHCDTDLISGHIGGEVVVDEDYRKAFTEGRTYQPKP